MDTSENRVKPFSKPLVALRTAKPARPGKVPVGETTVGALSSRRRLENGRGSLLKKPGQEALNGQLRFDGEVELTLFSGTLLT